MFEGGGREFGGGDLSVKGKGFEWLSKTGGGGGDMGGPPTGKPYSCCCCRSGDVFKR